MASCSYSRFNSWTKHACPDMEESLFSIGLRNLTHMFSFSPLVLGKARNGRDTMEPLDPSSFLLAFTSPPQRSLCFWFHRYTGPVPNKPGGSFPFPFGPEGRGRTVDPVDQERWVLSVSPWARVAVDVCVPPGAGRGQRRLTPCLLNPPLLLLLSDADLCCEKHLSGLCFFCRLSWKDKRGSDLLCKIRS